MTDTVSVPAFLAYREDRSGERPGGPRRVERTCWMPIICRARTSRARGRRPAGRDVPQPSARALAKRRWRRRSGMDTGESDYRPDPDAAPAAGTLVVCAGYRRLKRVWRGWVGDLHRKELGLRAFSLTNVRIGSETRSGRLSLCRVTGEGLAARPRRTPQR